MRGSTFTPIEDEAIAKSWIVSSEDPIVGTEQKGNDFFRKVQMVYNDNFKPTNRELRSLESIKVRCRAMHKDCMRFCGFHARIVRSNPTGVSGPDIIRLATVIYNYTEMGGVEDDCGKPFKFLFAWKTLRSHPKFMGALEKRRGSRSPNSSDGNSPAAESNESGAQLPIVAHRENAASHVVEERPVGRKRAKAAHEKSQQLDKKLKLAHASVVAQQERNKTLKRHFEIVLFTNAPEGCDSREAVEHFRIMGARALAEIRKEKTSLDASNAAPHTPPMGAIGTTESVEDSADE